MQSTRLPRQRDVTYSLAGAEPSARVLSLQAEADADVAKIYWFADRAFLGATTRAIQLSWEPKTGHYTIIAMDDHGRSDTRRINCSR